MNATELFHQDGRSAGVWYCAECNIVRKTQGQAEQCCKPWKCDRCGSDSAPYFALCSDCRNADRRAKELARLEAAELVEYDGGMLYSDDLSEHREGYFNDMDNLIEHLHDYHEIDDWPEFVYLTHARPFLIDLERVLEDAEAQLEWDAEWGEPGYSGLDEFKAAIEKFNAANQEIKTYWPDYKRKVRVPDGRTGERA